MHPPFVTNGFELDWTGQPIWVDKVKRKRKKWVDPSIVVPVPEPEKVLVYRDEWYKVYLQDGKYLVEKNAVYEDLGHTPIKEEFELEIGEEDGEFDNIDKERVTIDLTLDDDEEQEQNQKEKEEEHHHHHHHHHHHQHHTPPPPRMPKFRDSLHRNWNGIPIADLLNDPYVEILDD
ncbi:MAG: hypothetical protein EZS28_004091 [Streblomastix strix]|uniref:Uncharacterized protein n=1 Tax=Streblomastix strix TaxID=222440 RepID=A0A5J4WZ55_9EUKA|nr:MAG: hypothetical protein EZS28_004091 [Streblomastix strix]